MNLEAVILTVEWLAGAASYAAARAIRPRLRSSDLRPIGHLRVAVPARDNAGVVRHCMAVFSSAC